MFRSSRVPLAWRNLTHDKRRFALFVFGVAFAVFLMFAELGFYFALLDAPVRLIKKFNGEIIIVSTARYAMNVPQTFTTRRLDQARRVPGVLAAYPIYLEYAASWWKDVDPEQPGKPDRPTQLIRVIAFNPDQPALNIETVEKYHDELKIPYNVMLDSKSKPDVYGAVRSPLDRELAEHTVHVVRTFRLGTDFSSNGSVIMSDLTFDELFHNELAPETGLNLAAIGVVRLEAGADVEAVCEAIRETLPTDREGQLDVKVLSKDEYIKQEREFWGEATPVGFIFLMGMLMGFFVGAMICYQIISTDVTNHLPEYATLKAMGYTDRYLSLTVMSEALWLAVLGFALGWGLSFLFYLLIEWEIGLPMENTSLRVLFIFGLTTLMCALSGLAALQKVRKADPAEGFK